MSTYYFLGCDDHKVRTGVIAVERLTVSHLYNLKYMHDFILKHLGCNWKMFSEHDDERFNYEEIQGERE